MKEPSRESHLTCRSRTSKSAYEERGSRTHKRLISLQRAVPVAVAAVTASVIVLSIAPIVSLWVVTTNDLSDTAGASIAEQAESFRAVVVSKAVANVSAQLAQPGILAGMLRMLIPPKVILGDTSDYVDELHAIFVPMRINFPIFWGINVVYTNSRGMHEFGQVSSVVPGRDADYCIFDSDQSMRLRVNKYINGTVPTNVTVQSVAYYNVTARPWWIRGVYHNVAGVAWTGPFLCSTPEEGMLMTYTQVFKHPDPSYHAMIQVTLSIRVIEAYFVSLKHSANGWSFLLNDNKELVAASAGYPTMNQSTGLPIKAINSPNASMREVTSSWLELCGGAMCEKHFIYDGATFVDTSIAAQNGDLSWWIVLVTPASDFTAQMTRENDRARGKTRVTVAAVVTCTAVMGVVAVILAAGLGMMIIRPLAHVTEQMHQVSLMNLSALRGDAFSTPRRSSIREVFYLEKETEKMTNTLTVFSKYVPIAVVKNLVRNKLRPTFLDVVNFTETMDKYGADAIIGVMEQMFDFIDKYIGDSIMALWGCPDPVHNAEEKSCCAVAEIHQSMIALNSRFMQKYGFELGIRVGWHSGCVYAGNVGCSTRLNYTVLGNSVNLASRLESLNKEFGTSYCVSDSVREKFAFRCLGSVFIRGFSSAVTVHEFLGGRSDLSSQAQSILNNYSEIDEKLCRGECCVDELRSYVMEHPEDTAAPSILRKCTESK
eukprot:m51a1_g3853 hypothetical protein (713) ;mRNA; f:389032-391638